MYVEKKKIASENLLFFCVKSLQNENIYVILQLYKFLRYKKQLRTDTQNIFIKFLNLIKSGI